MSRLYPIFSRMARMLLPTGLSGEDGTRMVEDFINGDKPLMVARFGSVEIQSTLYSILPWPLNKTLKKKIHGGLINNAGFFPVNEAMVRRFGKLMIDSMSQLDCLATWRIEEAFFRNKLKGVSRVTLSSLSDMRWKRSLKGLRVLVVSPFAELIEEQYRNNREKIWTEEYGTLPEFKSLTTIKAENTIGGHSRFDTWFDALEHMKRQIDKAEFDVAILGCGAYGFPLAAHIKQIGGKAIHLGGVTQLIFGIKGKRWEGREFINEYWVSPRECDRPEGWQNVEGGCYW